MYYPLIQKPMLKKIIAIKNVALFQNVQSAAGLNIEFKKATLVYGDNASGKSSLSAVLRSASTRDASPVIRRKTNDQTAAQEINLLFNSNATFNDTAWAGDQPNISVFDSDFVAENVYSGQVVTTEHRRNLFVFALGDSVADQQQLDTLTKDASDAGRVVGEKKRGLEAHARPLAVDKFRALVADADIDQKIADNQKQIDSAKNVAAIASRKGPEKLKTVTFDLAAFFQTVAATVTGIEETAEATVRKHLATHPQKTYETWISDGQKHQSNDTCPYCNQSTAGLTLIEAYQSYFNEAYRAHKAQVDLLALSAQSLGSASVPSWEGALRANESNAEAWRNELVYSLPAFDAVAVGLDLEQAKTALKALADAKKAAPLDVVTDPVNQQSATDTMARVVAAITAYNTGVDKVVAEIAAVQKTVTAMHMPTLESTKATLAAEKRRFDPAIAVLVQEVAEAEAQATKLDNDKRTLKAKIDSAMATALSEYMDEINVYLKRFSAKFALVKLAPTFQGGGKPRTEYALEIRGREVGQLEKDPTRPGFDTVLSEGDKRTLAFAFFMAKLIKSGTLANQIVVFDDPMTSLDLHRKRETVKVLGEVAAVAKQLIVLSHDIFFLRENERALGGAATWKICGAPNNYSSFAPISLEVSCRSSYYKDYHLLHDYVTGAYTGDDRPVAIALRLVVEGFFNRRFPGVFGADKTFGAMIDRIEKNPTDLRFASLVPCIAKLKDFNDYARIFHHDSGDKYETGAPNPTQVRRYAEIALSLIHCDGIR